MIEVGRVCIKLRGSEKGRHCVVLEILDKNFVLIDGEVKRRRCNVLHLRPLPIKIEVSKNSSKEEILRKLKEAGIEVREVKKEKAQEKKEEAKEAKEEKKKKAKKEAKKAKEKKK
ncbi:50S ribosomal protein L14e [Nanoarchaeota archaeon]|nr:MAG: 50S ribosomal protein L14e [Nanoarchaeota archaeon]